MTTAVQRAGEDAQAPALLAAADAVFVPRGSWRYRDPGRIVAERIGADARTVIAELGVLQLTPFTRACGAIASGDLDVAVVVGGEAKYRDLRGRILGTVPVDTVQAENVVPDEAIRPADEIIPAPERAAGFMSAPLMYSALETALRSSLGESVAENARGNGQPVVAVQRGRGVESRRVAPRPGRAGVPRAPVGQEPDAGGPVHEVALLAVERRPGRRVRAVLHRGRRPRRCPRRAPRLSAGGGRVQPHGRRSRGGRSSTVHRPRASPPSASPTSPVSTWRPAKWSTSTAASPRRCASRPASSAFRSTTTVDRSASAAA